MKPSATLINGFGASVSSIFLSPDGDLKALALDKERVILLNLNEDPPLGHRIKAIGSGSSNVAFSPDGRLLASGGEFGDVVLWDVSSGQQSGPALSGHQRQVSSLGICARRQNPGLWKHGWDSHFLGCFLSHGFRAAREGASISGLEPGLQSRCKDRRCGWRRRTGLLGSRHPKTTWAACHLAERPYLGARLQPRRGFAGFGREQSRDLDLEEWPSGPTHQNAGTPLQGETSN